MNKEEKNIKEIVSNPSRLRESYVMKHAPTLYDKIISHIDLDIPFKEKLWYYYHNITEEFTCKCGNPTTFNKNFKDGYKKFCSAKCAQTDKKTKDKRKKTTKDKYGVDNVAKHKDIKEKTIQTNLKKYGTKSTFQNEDVRKRWKENIQEKYNVDHIFQLEEVKDRIKKTNNKKYDRDYYTQTEEYKERVKNTNLDKYESEWYLQSDDYKKKNKKTNLEKYGTEHYFNSDDYKKKLSLFLEENGVEFLSQLDVVREKISKSSQNKLRKLYAEKYDIDFKRSDEDGFIEFHSKDCGHDSKMSVSMFYKRRASDETICTVCNPFYEFKSEKEIGEFLDSLGVKYEMNKYTISSKYQLDFYLPDYNIGIEHNGLYWHGELHKPNGYHQQKTDFFKKEDIDIIHIWEDDWLDDTKKTIIQSIISNKVNIFEERIYARKTEFRKIDDVPLVRKFLNENHIQGYSNYSNSFGLYYNNELISLMTFGYRTLGKELELIRFCNKKGYSVVGGASKLFGNSIKEMEFDSMISYQDTSMFGGNLYKELNFKLRSDGYETYWWVVQGKRHNRQNFTKKKLIKEGFDPNKSGIEIMHEMGAYRVYGCKQKVWEYKNNI